MKSSEFSREELANAFRKLAGIDDVKNEPVEDGFFSIDDWAEMTGKSRTSTRCYITKMVKSGNMESRKYLVYHDGKPYKTSFYRLKTEVG